MKGVSFPQSNCYTDLSVFPLDRLPIPLRRSLARLLLSGGHFFIYIPNGVEQLCHAALSNYGYGRRTTYDGGF